MKETIFEKILKQNNKHLIKYQDDYCFVLDDINPQSLVHLLIIPKKVISRLFLVEENDKALLGHLMYIVKDQAKKNNLDRGYRVIINDGENAKQEIPHLHIHLIGIIKSEIKNP